MSPQHQVLLLNRLIQAEVDVTSAYSHAMNHLAPSYVRHLFGDLRSEHEMHIIRLSAEVRKLGGVPPQRKCDVRGYFITELTLVRMLNGARGALKAMKGNEARMARLYADASDWDLPDEIDSILEDYRRDGVRRGKVLSDAIRARLWEAQPWKKAAI